MLDDALPRSTTRQAVLVPGTCAGTNLPHARRTRIGLRDASVLLELADGSGSSTRELAGVTHVVVVPPEACHPRVRPRPVAGLVALMQGDRAGLVLDPRDWVAVPDALQGRDLRVVSGVEALARGLGLTVEAASPAQAQVVGRGGPGGITRPGSPSPGRAEDLTLVAAMVLGFLGIPFADSLLAPALATPALLLAALVVLRLHARRRRFRQAVESPPPPDGRQVIGSSLDPSWAGLSRSVLQLGADHVVHHARGRETWVPGPALGGAVRCVRAADDLVLVDAQGRPLLCLDGRPFDQDAVETAASAAGLDTERTPLPAGCPTPAELTLEHAAHPAVGGMSEVELGSETAATPALALCASLLLLVGSLLGLAATPLAWLLVAAALVLLSLVVHAWWLLRRWWSDDRADRRAPFPRRSPGTQETR